MPGDIGTEQDGTAVRTYILQRLALVVPTLLVVSFLVFAITAVLPGDTAAYIAGPEATKADLVRIRKEYRLDDPLVVQYGVWLGKVVRGNLGRSTARAQQPVVTLLRQRIPVTLELTALALLLAIVISIPLGTVSAFRRGSLVDIGISAAVLAGLSFPAFVLGYILIYLFGVRWQILPVSGFVPLTQNVVQNLKDMVLPAITVASTVVAAQTRMMRTSVLEVLRADYVRTARAKGLTERTVAMRHVLSNAMVPFITILGVQVAFLLGGAIIVESVFALPGLGTLAIDAILGRDIPTEQGFVLLTVVVYIAMSFVIDFLYGVFDPRVRLS